MITPTLAYLVPIFPVFTRFVLSILCIKSMADDLPEDAQERDVQRSFIFSLAGFSFTAVAGLAVLDASVRIGLQLPTWYTLLSFVMYIGALNAQSYKSNRWQNQLATTLLEVGTLSLMFSLVALMFAAPFSFAFQLTATSVILGVWLADHIIRLVIEYKYLAALHP